MAKRILIVDDEPSIRKVLSAHLRRFGHDVDTVADGAAAIAALQDEPFQLVVSDLKMPNVDGMQLLEWCVVNQPGLPVILITAHGTVDTAVTALKKGAFDYVTKPFDRDDLHAIITKALATEAANAKRLAPEPGEELGMVGRTPAMQEVYARIEKVAPSPTTVLITGESGTGKELVARALHARSDRASGPFIQVNCGAIPENLFESELFGYEKGAFTGAVGSKPGRFELADGGTLFLDEVGELPLDMQVKLLRALQEGVIDRVGGIRPLTVDVRVVAATNVDLSQAVANGRFRNDLYYRLNVIPIPLPPLRDRPEDVPRLAQHFLKRFNSRLQRDITAIDDDALVALQAYDWPGNIRELENLMERLVLLSDADRIRLADLPEGFELPEDDDPSEPRTEELESMGLKEYVRVHTVKLERARIQRVLDAVNGNVTRAAQQLGISRKSLQTKMKDYGLRED
ncbi:MAG: sigma-54-dependent Fis family transcriptional regulator [Alphaproteobacteria bacterium]|nr:sigma-54-dependent Fis family transcriptional regulator [Alphaproteobacteria bacterium]